jgi:hypothetical protein
MPVDQHEHSSQGSANARWQPWRGLARTLTLGVCCVFLAVILCANTASALNLYHDLFITLSARPLAMGGAAAAVPDPSSVFSNPAGLAALRNLRLLYNHSTRHFPGSREGGKHEWDQLDGDTEAVVVPLPLATYAHGFTLADEMGYDFTTHPPGGLCGYPREGLWGTEEYDALALGSGLPAAVGIALRRNSARFTPAPEDSVTPPWFRTGEGTQWGVLARVWPGVEYGLSELKLDYSWVILATPDATKADVNQRALPTMNSRLKSKRQGIAIHPCGWLVFASDSVREVYRIDDTQFYGVLHQGSAERASSHRGAELSLGNAAKLRWGDNDGQPTLGLSLALGTLWLNYTEAKGLLPRITGAGDLFKDVHIYGFDWSL